MREYFKSQLMAVVQGKQKEATAYMNGDQMKLMFQVGREVGFKTIASAMVEQSLVLLNEHDPFNVYVKVTITEVDSYFAEVKVTREWDPINLCNFLHEHQEEYFQMIEELTQRAYEEYVAMS